MSIAKAGPITPPKPLRLSILSRSAGAARRSCRIWPWLAPAATGISKYNRVAGRDPFNNEVATLFHPRRERWQEHFGWNEDYTRVIGLTPTGRATVTALQMNRSAVVNIREVLYAAGKHPPQFD